MFTFFLCVLGLVASMAPAGSLAQDTTSLEDVDVLTTPTEQDEIVEKHNSLRASVSPSATNMLKMSWNKEAAANAQKWASNCNLKHSNSIDREISTSGCGENLYMSTNNNSWSDAIQSWYDEVIDWRYGVGSVNGKVVGHFTQVVWYRSNQIGCAKAYCPNSIFKYFYVCQYCPPGNYQHARPYTSGSSCGDCLNDCDNKLCTNPCQYINKFDNCDSLKQMYGCDQKDVKSWCPASCRCTNQIV